MPISPEFALAPTMHYCQRAERKTMEQTTEKSVRVRVHLRVRVRLRHGNCDEGKART